MTDFNEAWVSKDLGAIIENCSFGNVGGLLLVPVAKGFENVEFRDTSGENAMFPEVAILLAIGGCLFGGRVGELDLKVSSLESEDKLTLSESFTGVPDNEALEMRRSSCSHFSSDNGIGGFGFTRCSKLIIFKRGWIVYDCNPLFACRWAWSHD